MESLGVYAIYLAMLIAVAGPALAFIGRAVVSGKRYLWRATPVVAIYYAIMAGRMVAKKANVSLDWCCCFEPGCTLFVFGPLVTVGLLAWPEPTDAHAPVSAGPHPDSKPGGRDRGQAG